MAAFGLIGFHATLHAWLSFAGNILGPVVNREVARLATDTRDAQVFWNKLRSMELIGISCSTGVSIFLLLASRPIADFWLQTSTVSAKSIAVSVSLIGLIIALRILETVYQGAIAGLQKQLPLNIIIALIATLRWGGAIGVLAWGSPTIEYFFAWQVFVSAFSLLILNRFAYHALPKPQKTPQFTSDAFRSLRDFSGGMLVTTLFALLLTNADKLLLSKLLSLEEFGYYMLAFTIASGLFFFINPISQAYYPQFSQLVALGDVSKLSHRYHQACKLVTLGIGPLCLLMALFSREILFAWSGDHQLSAQVALLLPFLAIGNGLHGLMHVPYMLQLANGWTSLSARINIIACLILLPALILAVPRHGATAAALIWITLNLGYVLLGIKLMHSKLLQGEMQSWYTKDILKPILPSLVILTLTRLTLPDNLSRTTIAATLIGTITIIYGIAAFSVRNSSIRVVTNEIN